MNYVADWLLYTLNFEQLELYAQNQHNKKASLETIKDKTIKENKKKIKKLSKKTLNNNKIKNYEYVTIVYNDGSTIAGEKMW